LDGDEGSGFWGASKARRDDAEWSFHPKSCNAALFRKKLFNPPRSGLKRVMPTAYEKHFSVIAPNRQISGQLPDLGLGASCLFSVIRLKDRIHF
jgi:hypothetical protein